MAKLFVIMTSLSIGALISLLICSLIYGHEEQVWIVKLKEKEQQFIKASTLLKYHDSINNSGLIINLSKYQLEYVKREIDKIK